MGRRLTHCLGIVCCIVFVAMGDVYAQGLIGSEVAPAKGGFDTAAEQQDAKRFRYVRVNPDVLAESRFSMELFQDVTLEAVEQERGRQLNVTTWTGRVEGEPFSSVVMALDDSGVLFGKVEVDRRIFLIRPKSGLVHALLEVTGDVPLDEGADDGVRLPEEEFDASLGKGAAVSACLPSSTCSSKTIDVMVVYTSQARSALGGTHASAQAAIAAAVAEMNTANTNSGVTHTFNLVHAEEVWYVESGNANTDLSRLSGSFDGYMDQIHDWRDDYGADLVSLITDTGGCGIGYVQGDPTLLSSSAAFNVVRDDCLTTNRSLAHEIGHNMGLHHDWYVNSNVTPCLWHHGYVNQEAFGGTSSQRWRTIMAYNNQCSSQGGFNCSRYRYWSNPLVQKDGDPMGVPQGQSNPSDAVFALNRTACQVAEFRASTSTPDPPMYPTELVATGASESMINVSWSDNATDETGYKVQRSVNGASGWSDIATLTANAEAYSDTGLPEGSAFYYRTYAFHATSQSEFSNVDSASTMVSYVDYVAQGETVRYGTTSGSLSNTYSNDGASKVLQEEVTGGLLQNRTSRLDVTWEFSVASGLPAVVHVNAWSPSSSDNDQIELSYSFDGVSFAPMLLLTETSDTNVDQSYNLGVILGSSVWIRVQDTDRNRGSSSVDNVYVDHLIIRSEASGDAEPPASEVSSIHLGDLQASVEGNKRWTMVVEATVHGGHLHLSEAGVTVAGTWSDGNGSTCVTDDSGVCSMARAWKPKVGSAGFSVTSLSKEDVTYDSAQNETSGSVTAVAPDGAANNAASDDLPDRLTLRQNYPNPFNPSTTLEYGVPQTGPVRVSVFNSIGIEVKRLRDGVEEEGWHSVVLDASDLSSGVYFAVVRASETTTSRTMLLMK